MSPAEALRRALWAVVWLSAPTVLAIVIGAVLVELGQSLLKLSGSTAPRAVRLIVGLVCVLALGAWMAGQVVRFTAAMLTAAGRTG